MERATGLRQLVNDTTRYSTVNTTIDLIFINSDCIANSGVLNVNVSDHQARYVTRKKTRVSNEKIRFRGRSYRNYKKEVFKAKLIDHDWTVLNDTINVEQYWETILGIIETTLDQMCPMKEYFVKDKKDPWMTNEILEIIMDKAEALRRAKRNKTEANMNKARLFKNRAKSVVQKARASYIKDRLH